MDQRFFDHETPSRRADAGLALGTLVHRLVITAPRRATTCDLVHRTGAAWRLVDYKTDRDSSGEALAQRYVEQVLAYDGGGDA